jgi:hypothetical protein
MRGGYHASGSNSSKYRTCGLGRRPEIFDGGDELGWHRDKKADLLPATQHFLFVDVLSLSVTSVDDRGGVLRGNGPYGTQ